MTKSEGRLLRSELGEWKREGGVKEVGESYGYAEIER